MARSTDAILRLQEAGARRHEYAREWKRRTGGRVVGYLCTYVPEELFYAAGVLPVRIVGSHEPESVTAPHIFGMFCSYCRDLLAQGLQGRYDYLDAVATAHCCVHSLQTFDSWRRHIPISRTFYIAMPQCIWSRGALPALSREMEGLKRDVEEWVGSPIPAAALKKAIAAYDRNRRLMRQVYELRRQDHPPISGAQCMEMVLASQVMDKKEHSRMLMPLLRQLQSSPVANSTGIRLLVAGQMDNVELLRLVEGLGATVVADDLCFGSRYFWNSVGNSAEPLAALARRYIERPPCPMKDLRAKRVRPGYVLGLAQQFRAQSAILVRQQFCDPHEYDIPAVRKLLQANGIPSLTLEQDITIPVGQLRTRIEAHLEMVQQTLE